MVYYADLLFLDFLNKFRIFPKFIKNNITIIVSDRYIFKADYIIDNNST